MAGLLDAHKEFTKNKCTQLEKESSIFEKAESALGISNITKSVQGFLEKDIVSVLSNSPLRKLGEDVLAQAITNNARRLSQNLLNQVPDSLTKTLADARNVVFGAVLSTITFKNDMVLYFASIVAQEAVDAIREKRNNLIALQESVRKLHNALLVLAGGGPFFNKYLADLRAALLKINEAEQNVTAVQSAFYSTEFFPQSLYENSKRLLTEAHDLIMPPVSNQDTSSLNQGFLKNVFQAPEYGLQLSMLVTIPKLTFNMLKQYDAYALKVAKVDLLILGFQNIVQNLQKVTAGKYKDTVLAQLNSTRTFLRDIVSDMSLQLNNSENKLTPDGSNFNPNSKFTYVPNPTKTSTKAVGWGVRVQSAKVMLNFLDPKSLQAISISNTGLNAYNTAITELAKKDSIRTATAILTATDAKEALIDMEGDFTSFAFMANQAILDSSKLDKTNSTAPSQNALALGAKVNSRLQLSIDQDREIETILLVFIKTIEPILDSIKSLGDSLFSFMDDLGMDRASDALKKGAFGDFFSMDGKTATYVGAAVAGLGIVKNGLTNSAHKECLESAIVALKREEASKNIVATKISQKTYASAQAVNEAKCKKFKDKEKEIEACTVGIDKKTLNSVNTKSLSSLFKDFFGGSTADSLQATSGISQHIIESSGSSVFTDTNVAAIASKEGIAHATKLTETAKKSMATAINKVDGFKATAKEPLAVLNKKLNSAKKVASGTIGTELHNAGVSKKVADIAIKESEKLTNNVKIVSKVF